MKNSYYYKLLFVLLVFIVSCDPPEPDPLTYIKISNEADYDICATIAVHVDSSKNCNPFKSYNKFYPKTNLLYCETRVVQSQSYIEGEVSCISKFPETWRDIFDEGADTVLIAIFKKPDVEIMSRDGSGPRGMNFGNVALEWLNTRNDSIPLFIFKLTEKDFNLGWYEKEIVYQTDTSSLQ